MGLNLGVLGQVLLPSMVGLQKGAALGEAETYKRQQEQEALDRQLRRQALQDYLSQQQESRLQAASDAQIGADNARAGYYDAQRAKLEAPQTDKPIDPYKQSEIDLNHARQRKIEKETGQVGLVKPPKPKELNWQKELESVATAANGDLAQAHRLINQDERLFKLRADGTIRDYDVASAVAKARKSLGIKDEKKKEGMSAKYRKFPSESTEAWVRRMKAMGLTAQQVQQYGQAQGL